jgi:hypothetical protein
MSDLNAMPKEIHVIVRGATVALAFKMGDEEEAQGLAKYLQASINNGELAFHLSLDTQTPE